MLHTIWGRGGGENMPQQLLVWRVRYYKPLSLAFCCSSTSPKLSQLS